MRVFSLSSELVNGSGKFVLKACDRNAYFNREVFVQKAGFALCSSDAKSFQAENLKEPAAGMHQLNTRSRVELFIPALPTFEAADRLHISRNVTSLIGLQPHLYSLQYATLHYQPQVYSRIMILSRNEFSPFRCFFWRNRLTIVLH